MHILKMLLRLDGTWAIMSAEHIGKERMVIMVKNYRKTLLACYLGFVTQAIAANFAPLLFLKFHADYGIPLDRKSVV